MVIKASTLALVWLLLSTLLLVSHSVWAEETTSLNAAAFAPIADIVEAEIQAGHIPGAVVLIGQHDHVLYREALGFRALVPEKLPMTADTIFDLASLTKVVATTTAVMQLVEQQALDLDAPAAAYWPEFAANGKEQIRLKDLLTHYSGLRPDLNLHRQWSGYHEGLQQIVIETPVSPPGTRYRYSDINFAVLGELVRRVSGLPLDEYCNRFIFAPLRLRDTSFRPVAEQRLRIAPTTFLYRSLLQGEVHDPTAYRMGGVAGHAGVFSTADDLATIAQMLLDGGHVGEQRILSRASIAVMTTRQSPPNGARVRGLGWDFGVSRTERYGNGFLSGAYGHTGYTGTSLWIDPESRTYVIILTNRVHPYGRGNVQPLRDKITNCVAALLAAAQKGRYPRPTTIGRVKTGIDVLTEERFSPLAGLRVGLITNHTGRDSIGQRTADLLYRAPGVKLVALFSPEHGLYGNVDERVGSTIEPTTGLPVYSLYGAVRRPTPAMLAGVEALVFDIQDAGVRFYTYISTMAYAMEAASQKAIPFYVLDRPNPLTAEMLQGPVLDEDLRSFTGYFPLPVRHGMTVGELATMFNRENQLGVNLHVVPMRGYQREAWFDQTGLPWVAPSPNLRTLTAAILYPGVALVEGANVSVGRGTASPFELVGAPWINGRKLATYLNQRQIAGVSFVPQDFTPTANRYAHQLCHGIHIELQDRQALDVARLGLEIASALFRLHPTKFELARTLGLFGARWVVSAIRASQDPREIMQQWQPMLETFRDRRAKYLLYPDHQASDDGKPLS